MSMKSLQGRVAGAFVRNFPVDEEISWQQVVVMEYRKRHETADTTHFCWRKLVTDLLRTCYGGSRQLVTDLLRGNWCNEFWPLFRRTYRKLGTSLTTEFHRVNGTIGPHMLENVVTETF